MTSRFNIMVLTWVLVPLVFAGCGQDSSPPKTVKPPPARQKVKTALSAKASVPAAVATKEKSSEFKSFVYNPSGKRDPFQTFLELAKAVSSQEETPLQKYALNQLRVIGVVWGKGEPHAMVVGPDGKAFILKKGVKVGKNDGTVVEITREEVLVEEKYFDFIGTTRTVQQKIPLPTTKKE